MIEKGHIIPHIAVVLSDARIRSTDNPEERAKYYMNRGVSFKIISIILLVICLSFGLAAFSVIQRMPLYEKLDTIARSSELTGEIEKLQNEYEAHLTDKSLHASSPQLIALFADLQLMKQEINALEHTVFKDRTEAIGSLNNQIRTLSEIILDLRRDLTAPNNSKAVEE